ncbi:hypothetical protein D9M72_639190 [compost metagenome]
MWLPLTSRTLRLELSPAIRPMTSLTHGPAVLTTERAFTSVFTPVRRSVISTCQRPSTRRMALQAVRVRTRAPFFCASSALSTTRRASSTQQSEYSKALR